MNLLQEILKCEESQIDEIIAEAIKKANENSEKVEKIGFLNYNKSKSLFKGFIPLETRIKYASINFEDYSMNTTDFFYEFAHYARKNKISNEMSLINSLELFLVRYFGTPG